MSDLTSLTSAIEKGDRETATRVTAEAIAAKTPPGDILAASISGMDVVGKRFKAGELYVPEVLIAARAMKESMALLEPVLVEAGLEPEFTALVGTVQGDLHDIGKNLVAMMWKGAGFKIVDLGTNVPPQAFVEAAKEHQAQVVGLSALLTTTMAKMADVVKAFHEAGLDEVKIIVGGAPLSESFASEIGAHGYAPDAASAVETARQFASAS